MMITIIGASGFLGQNLTMYLLAHTDYQLRAFCRSAKSLRFSDAARVTPVAGDIFDEQALQIALQGADAAVYFIHMMGSQDRDFYDKEAEAAQHFAKVAKDCGVKRVVYMSGLGNDADQLSKHLASRHHTGQILAEQLPSVIELRASMIIGDGSVAYDIIKAIAHKLPMLMVPRWAVTKTQPISLLDALQYITAALQLAQPGSVIVEIGGPEQLTYPEILEHYARWRHHREYVLVVPLVPRWAAIWWLNQFLPAKDSGIGGPMIDSLRNEMVVTNNTAQQLFPAIKPLPIEECF